MTPRPTATRPSPAEFTAAAEVLKALAHATRAMVVVALADGERCVADLAELADCDMSTMSNHLTVLRHAGVVGSERRGSQVFYRLTRPCVLDMLNCLTGGRRTARGN
ncbi:MAG: winged helix-turn-helix transcriptional regulator [Planctomycetes bacterium]|nr:winged helix-turn-helix transcriptional regulator [Planctomycetota bacterium]